MIFIASMKETIEENRPYEKFMSKGPKALTDSELLAIIIRTGTYEKTSVSLCEAILSLSKNGIAGLTDLSINELTKLKGIGRVKAIQIKCIAELSRRIAKSSISLKTDDQKYFFSLKAYIIETTSMEPELKNGDVII